MATKKTKKQGQAVLVTTEKRGVFFGYLVGKASKEQVVLTRLRNCVYWTQQTKGFLGLAESGPGTGCRVGPAVPEESTLYDVTGCYTCTPEAIEKWEGGPWS